MSAAGEDLSTDVSMSLGDHLEELRWRLIKVILAALLCTILAFIFHRQLKLIALQPLMQAIEIVGEEVAQALGFDASPGATRQLRGKTLLEPTITSFTISLLASLFAVMPYITWQIWAFVRPALRQHEKGLALLFLPSAVILFYSGAISGYLYALPWFYAWLMQWAVEDPTVSMILHQREYLRLLVMMTVCFGVICDVPWFVILLVRLRLVTPQQIARNRRFVILGAIVAAALLSPPDPISQLALFVPLVFLFEIGLLLSRIAHRYADAGTSSSESGSCAL